MHTQEEAVRLREEVSYKRFYPDLDVNDDVVFTKETGGPGQMGGDDENASLLQYMTSWKQLIVNDTITMEKLGPQIKHAEFKRCGIQISQLNPQGRVNKQYLRYGYGTQNGRCCALDKKTYCKKTDILLRHKNEYFADISPYQVNFKVEYDMDEQDDLFLRHLNESFSNPRNKITHELFEIIITVLENEAFHLEKKIPPRVSPTSTNDTHESHAAWKHHELYGSDDGTGYPMDQPCAVCGGIECDNSNAIVFCDGCDIAVHQECYGVVFIPEGQWLCRRCMISKNRKIGCLFCPSTTGAFKQTDNGSWGHVVCEIWIPELYFGNLHYMEPIGGIENIPKSRWKLVCYICKQEVGACIQCSNKNCFAAYHTTCAKRAGLYMNFNGCTVQEAASKSMPPGAFLESYCHKHSPKGWNDCEEGIRKTREYFKHVNDHETLLNTVVPTNSNNSTQKTTKNKWKTSRGTLIAPQKFADIVQMILKRFHIPETERISFDFCKYWTMKRELKRGAPLVRKFSPSSLNTLSSEELQDRIEFSELLLQDLNQLEDLASTFVEKHKCNVKKVEKSKICYDIAFHPVRYILRESVWDNLSKSSSFKTFMQLEESAGLDILRPIEQKLTKDEYESIYEFKSEVIEKLSHIVEDGNYPRLLTITASKLLQTFQSYICKIDGIDIKSLLNDDFDIDEKTHKIEEVAWKGRKLLMREDLSDVEDLSIMEERQLKGALRD